MLNPCFYCRLFIVGDLHRVYVYVLADDVEIRQAVGYLFQIRRRGIVESPVV